VKLLGTRPLSVLLIGTLLFCHGVFGGLHLECGPPEWCAGDAEHAEDHQPTTGAGETHEHHAGHGVSTVYFAVVALGLLGLLLRLLPNGAVGLKSWLGIRWPALSPGAGRVASPTNPHATHASGVEALRGSSPR
jgi:hypothetical protein